MGNGVDKQVARLNVVRRKEEKRVKRIFYSKLKLYPFTTHNDTDGGSGDIFLNHITILEFEGAKEFHPRTPTQKITEENHKMLLTWRHPSVRNLSQNSDINI